MFLFEEVDNLVGRYEEAKDGIRSELMKGARSVILSSAESGSKKSVMSINQAQLSEVDWLRKELRSEGVSASVQGEMLHFKVTGPRALSRRSLQYPEPNKNDPEDYYAG